MFIEVFWIEKNRQVSEIFRFPEEKTAAKTFIKNIENDKNCDFIELQAIYSEKQSVQSKLGVLC